MKIKLERDIRTPSVTLGRLILPNKEGKKTILATLELPWKDNANDISCIPVGIYKCVWHDSPKHPGSYEITNVPDRTECLIHPGNFTVDTKGCILPGMLRDLTMPSVQQSKPAMEIIHSILGKEDFELEIVEV